MERQSTEVPITGIKRDVRGGPRRYRHI